MSIIRVARPQSNFYILDKRISEDRGLSWAARGLLIFLLGKPDHWKVSVEHLRKETQTSAKPSGRDAIYAMLTELINNGYVKRELAKGDGGTLAGYDYYVFDDPVTLGAAEDLPCTAFPDTAEPDTVEPYTANPTLVSIDVKKVLKEANLSGALDVWEESFDQFWQQYPYKVAKANALKAWRKIKPDAALLAKILASLEVAKSSDGWKKDGGRFIPHATTWLNGRRWEDEIGKAEASEEVLDPRAKAPPSWFKLPPGAKWTPGKGVTW